MILDGELVCIEPSRQPGDECKVTALHQLTFRKKQGLYVSELYPCSLLVCNQIFLLISLNIFCPVMAFTLPSEEVS